MKIINITLDAQMAGPQIRIVEIGSVLTEKYNCETIVLLPVDKSETFIKWLKAKRMNYIQLKLTKLSKSPVKILKWAINLVPEIVRLKKIFKEVNPDIIHCNGSWQFKGVIAGKLAKKKVIWHLNDSKIPFLVRVIFRRINKNIYNYIFAGDKVKDYYTKYIKHKRHEKVIYAPVNMNYYAPSQKIKHSFLTEVKGIKITTTANVNPIKGIEYFVKAAFLLTKKFININFFVVGSLFESQKKYINKIWRMIEEYKLDNFFLCGYCDNVLSILNDTDIYVCTSLNEAAPMSVWEAMAMEKPIVSTDVGEVSKFIKNGENGFIVPVGDYRKIAEKIEYLINNKNLWKSFGQKSRKTVGKELDVINIARLHAEIYGEITSNEFKN